MESWFGLRFAKTSRKICFLSQFLTGPVVAVLSAMILVNAVPIT